MEEEADRNEAITEDVEIEVVGVAHAEVEEEEGEDAVNDAQERDHCDNNQRYPTSESERRSDPSNMALSSPAHLRDGSCRE